VALSCYRKGASRNSLGGDVEIPTIPVHLKRIDLVLPQNGRTGTKAWLVGLVSYRMERVMSLSAPCLTLFMVLIAAAFSAAPGQSYTDDAVLQYAKP